MRLLIKQRVFSWSDTYDVYDEFENVRYFVKGEVFSLGHCLHVYNAYQMEVGRIREKLLTFLPAFEIETNGVVRGRIRKKFSFFHPEYEVEFNGWQAEGDFLGWNYEVTSGFGPVVHITKEWLHWGDTYVLDFLRPEDELEGLLLALAIDAANCSEH